MKVAKHSESFLKSLVWRCMGVIILASVVFFFTGNWIITTTITVIHHATFLLVFYLNERMWTKITKLKGKLRNIIKALEYEIILGMGIGGLIVYLVTDSFPSVTKITGTYTVIKIITYFFYDKLWPEFKKEN